MAQNNLNQFAIELFKVKGVKFGQFKTKVGLDTPIYCDLRVLISYPSLMQTLGDIIAEYIKNVQCVDVLCGVPYTALPIATVVSLKTNIPMIMRRKEPKNYGTKNLIEGAFKEGDKCLIIEDIVTSGSSILETVNDLKNQGLICTDVIVLLNREQGGEKILLENGIKMHALLSISKLMNILYEEKLVDDKTVEDIKKYISDTQVTSQTLKKESRLKLSFQQRIQYSTNPITTKLFQIMEQKQTNLCVAVDVTDSTKLLNISEEIGPYICCLKLHIDILEDFHINLIKHLKEIADRHNFILFEDRKFADIGKTVQYQYSNGIYKISTWAELITVHTIMGKGVLEGLKSSDGLKDRGIFVLAQASSAGNLISDDYTKKSINLAVEYKDIVTGIVCQDALFLEHPGFIQLTPGVQIDSIGDNLGQKYSTPEFVVLEKGCDIAVVGRGVTNSGNLVESAKLYKDRLWKAYNKRIQNY